MSRLRVFALGVLTGVLGSLYARGVYLNWQYYREYDQAMTDLFNSVPESQRFGYTKDFPKNTQWSL